MEFFIFLKEKNNLLAPIFWQSRKIQRVTRSTLAAETLAFINGVAIVFIKHIFEEILGKNLPIIISCFLDNNSLFELHIQQRYYKTGLYVQILHLYSIMKSK